MTLVSTIVPCHATEHEHCDHGSHHKAVHHTHQHDHDNHDEEEEHEEHPCSPFCAFHASYNSVDGTPELVTETLEEPKKEVFYNYCEPFSTQFHNLIWNPPKA